MTDQEIYENLWTFTLSIYIYIYEIIEQPRVNSKKHKI